MNQHGKPFIVKLFEIFSKEDPSYKWTENGNILIINTYNFAENIMPKYYKSSSITSFIRQLNMYGFTKKSSKSNILEYNHPFFQKGKAELLLLITRNKKRGNEELQLERPSNKKQAIVLNNDDSKTHFESDEYQTLKSEMEKMRSDFEIRLSKLKASLNNLQKIIERNKLIEDEIIKVFRE